MSWNVRVKGPYAHLVPDWLESELKAQLPAVLAEVTGQAAKEGAPPVRFVDDKARKPRLADG